MTAGPVRDRGGRPIEIGNDGTQARRGGGVAKSRRCTPASRRHCTTSHQATGHRAPSPSGARAARRASEAVAAPAVAPVDSLRPAAPSRSDASCRCASGRRTDSPGASSPAAHAATGARVAAGGGAVRGSDGAVASVQRTSSVRRASMTRRERRPVHTPPAGGGDASRTGVSARPGGTRKLSTGCHGTARVRRRYVWGVAGSRTPPGASPHRSLSLQSPDDPCTVRDLSR